jgi:hypothetical protein
MIRASGTDAKINAGRKNDDGCAATRLVTDAGSFADSENAHWHNRGNCRPLGPQCRIDCEQGFLKLHPPKWWITLWMNLRPTAEVCKVLAIFMNFW